MANNARVISRQQRRFVLVWILPCVATLLIRVWIVEAFTTKVCFPATNTREILGGGAFLPITAGPVIHPARNVAARMALSGRMPCAGTDITDNDTALTHGNEVDTTSTSTEKVVIIRATLPSFNNNDNYYRFLTYQTLQKHEKLVTITPQKNNQDNTNQKIKERDNIVAFSITNSNGQNYQNMTDICRSLPVSQVSLVVAEWAIPTTDPGHDRKSAIPSRLILSQYLADAMSVWEELGNVNHEEVKVNRSKSTFRISIRQGRRQPSPRRKKNKRKDVTASTNNNATSSEVESLMVNDLGTSISHIMGWDLQTGPKTMRTDATYSFLLHVREEEELGHDIIHYSLELQVLVRRWPLPSKSSSDNFNPSTKRIESFAVAKSARIQPKDIIWDPFCQRGTFLVEAAKYWPTASYHGSDSNMGNLQHAQMNAQSTLTHLCLYHDYNDEQINVSRKQQLQQPAKQSVDQLKKALAHEHVDKILTRLPSFFPEGQPSSSLATIMEYYQTLLQEWARVLRPSGSSSLVLLVDVPQSLDALQAAVKHLDSLYDIAFIRSPSFVLGKKQRVTVVILRYLPLSTTDIATTGLLDWEKITEFQGSSITLQSDQHVSGSAQRIWPQVRTKAIPWMVPYSFQHVPATRIRLPNDKFV